MDLKRIYEYALQREREGRDYFLRAAERTGHAAAAGIFRRLAEEEERHIEFIQGLLDLLAGGKAAPARDVSDDGAFDARAEAEQLDQSVVEAMTPDVAILRTAYLIERDFVEFYRMAADKAEGEARRALLRLAEWEQGHEELFRTMHDRVFEEYTRMPWGG